MKIKKIIINNFRAFKYADINIEDFNCIIGKNDSGKSTIFAALEWFFGKEKKLNECDFAAAGFDWVPYEITYTDERTEEESSVMTEDVIYDGFCISVDVFFSDVYIPEQTENNDFIFSKDFLFDGCLCIRKYMRHPFAENQAGETGYCIKTNVFNPIGKIFTKCSFEEIINAYAEIGGETVQLCKHLNILKGEERKKTKKLSLIDFAIKDEEREIKKHICNELYNHYKNNSYEIDNNTWLEYNSTPFFPSFPDFKLYTSKTPIKEYLNELFSPEHYKSVEKLKERTAEKISELVGLNKPSEKMSYKKNERINLFSEDTLVFSKYNGRLEIPLKNRGEGFQLKIKNAVFRLHSDIHTKNQHDIIFAIEEPETHLHPSAQIEMYETLKKLLNNPKNQVIITTHSPYIVKKWQTTIFYPLL